MWLDDQPIYEFGPFRLDSAERRLLKDGAPVPLSPKVFDMLVLLVSNDGRLVKKDEFFEQVWPHALVEESNIASSISLLRKALGDNPRSPEYIQTVSGSGYRFAAPVRRVRPEYEATATGQNDPLSGVALAYDESSVSSYEARAEERYEERLRSSWLHVLVCCSLYALLYAISIFVEVAYRLDDFGETASIAAPATFVWMASTSVVGLWVGSRSTWRGKNIGLHASLFIFISAAILLFAVLTQFLPGEPVTEARFQTFTAQGAYLKNVIYLLALAILYMIVPFHLIASIRGELQMGNRRVVGQMLLSRRQSMVVPGAIYLRVRWLTALLLLVFVAAVLLTAHLFENLRLGPYHNLFTQLVLWRVFLYFFLASECLFWYYRRLAEIRRAISVA